MKRSYLIILIAILALCIGWVIFIGYVNTRATALNVQISGNVDEVVFFRMDDPNNPVSSIRTNGKDTSQVVNLPNSEKSSLFIQTRPAQYYFVTKKGDLRYRSKPICCQTGLNLIGEQRLLIIRDIEQYEIK